MTTQPQLEMLPKTQLDIAKIFLSHFEDEVEKTSKAMLNAQAKVAEALKLREMAEHEVARHAGESVAHAAADIVNSGALDTDDMTVTASVTPASSQSDFTDEVAAELDTHGIEYQRDKPLPAVDPVTGEVDEVTGAVLVIDPGAKYSHLTDVGSRTQYGELVADYLTTLPAVSPHRDDPVDYYRVIGVDDEIYRDLRSPVSLDDYGVELAVVRLVDASEVRLLEDAVQ